MLTTTIRNALHDLADACAEMERRVAEADHALEDRPAALLLTELDKVKDKLTRLAKLTPADAPLFKGQGEQAEAEPMKPAADTKRPKKK